MMFYAEFNDKKVGLKAMTKDNLLRTNRSVPVEKNKVLFDIRRNRANLVAIKCTQLP